MSRLARYVRLCALMAPCTLGGPLRGQTRPANASPPVPAVFNPVGLYDFTAYPPNGGAVEGRIKIDGAPGQYTGFITPDGSSSMVITSVLIRGDSLIIAGDAPDGGGKVQADFTVRGDSLEGRYQSPNEAGTIKAKKLPPR